MRQKASGESRSIAEPEAHRLRLPTGNGVGEVSARVSGAAPQRAVVRSEGRGEQRAAMRT